MPVFSMARGSTLQQMREEVSMRAEEHWRQVEQSAGKAADRGPQVPPAASQASASGTKQAAYHAGLLDSPRKQPKSKNALDDACPLQGAQKNERHNSLHYRTRYPAHGDTLRDRKIQQQRRGGLQEPAHDVNSNNTKL
jgi:hypothetical protein